MDPAYLLEQYGAAFFWIAIAIVFIECGLLFPILPGDSLLFAVGLFIATGQVQVNIAVAVIALCTAGLPRQRRRLRDRTRHRHPALRARRAHPQEEVLRPDDPLLRQARQQGPRHRPLRADRAHLHHRRRRRQPDGPPTLLHVERDRRRALGRRPDPARLLPRRDVPGAVRQPRARRAAHRRRLRAADGRRVPPPPPPGQRHRRSQEIGEAAEDIIDPPRAPTTSSTRPAASAADRPPSHALHKGPDPSRIGPFAVCRPVGFGEKAHLAAHPGAHWRGRDAR